jgi:hypothetical protein
MASIAEKVCCGASPLALRYHDGEEAFEEATTPLSIGRLTWYVVRSRTRRLQRGSAIISAAVGHAGGSSSTNSRPGFVSMSARESRRRSRCAKQHGELPSRTRACAPSSPPTE